MLAGGLACGAVERLVYHYLAFTSLQLVQSSTVRLVRQGDKFRLLVTLQKLSVTPIVERCSPFLHQRCLLRFSNCSVS